MFLRVLYIEDDPTASALVRAGLEGRTDPAFSVECVGSLAGATAALSARRFNVVLLDLGLPDSDGVDTLSSIRAAAPDVPIVVLTSHAYDKVGLATLHHGADEFLEKENFDGNLLSRMVMFAIERRRLLNEVSQHLRHIERAETERTRLSEAVMQVDELVMVTDLHSVIEYANPAFERITGYSAEEAVGRRTSLLRSDATPEGTYRELWESLSQGRTWHGRFINRRKDGDLYLQHSVISPIRGAAGEIVGYVGLGRDVTVETQVEAQLRQSQKLQALGQLASGVAHDFNNNLAVIMTVAQVVRDDLAAVGSEHVADLDEILQAARRAEGVAARLLGFSRQAALRMKPVEIHQLLHGMTRMLRAALPTSIHLTVKADDDLPEILADGHAVEQIVLNLVTNARDAMPKGGEVTVVAERADVDEAFLEMHPETHPGDHVCISVADSGTGIDPEIRSQIFTPFFTTKDEGKGTGLGLSMVHGLVEQHSGAVHVYSEPGMGTVMKLYFPALRERRKTQRSETTGLALDARRGETILLVEDDPSLRRAAERVFARAGYQVRVAGDGRAGLETFEATPEEIDLVVSDVVMPGLTGRELLDAVRRKGYPVPFVLTSGYLEKTPGKEAPSQADVSYLSKPWTVDELLRTVRRSLDEADAATSA